MKRKVRFINFLAAIILLFFVAIFIDGVLREKTYFTHHDPLSHVAWQKEEQIFFHGEDVFFWNRSYRDKGWYAPKKGRSVEQTIISCIVSEILIILDEASLNHEYCFDIKHKQKAIKVHVNMRCKLNKAEVQALKHLITQYLETPIAIEHKLNYASLVVKVEDIPS